MNIRSIPAGACSLGLAVTMSACAVAVPPAPEVTEFVTETVLVTEPAAPVEPAATADQPSHGHLEPAAAQRIETELHALANQVSTAFSDPNHAVGTIPAEEPTATTAVPSFHLPHAVSEDANTTHEKELISSILPDFANVLSQNSELNAVYLGTEKGVMMRYMVPTEPLSPQYDARQRPWYQDAIAANGQLIWTDVYVDAFTGGDVVSAAQAVYAENGTLIGVVGVDVLV